MKMKKQRWIDAEYRGEAKNNFFKFKFFFGFKKSLFKLKILIFKINYFSENIIISD